jgi:hypothetical protein
MGIDIGQGVIEWHHFAALGGSTSLVNIGPGPSEVTVAGRYEIGNRKGDGVVDGAEPAGGDLFLQPFPLSGGKLDIHDADIDDP